jgi:hypothetical protein
MAPPMSANTFLAALRAEGLTVIEEGNWRDHNRNSKGPWGPVHGVMIHHTVTRGHDHTVDICRRGYSGLPGPLCHGVICKKGHVHLVGYGRANHAGLGDDDVLRAVIAERDLPADNEANTDGNRHFYGFECENLGDGKDPWPPEQLLAIEKAAAAIARHHGWNERSVIGHLEWQPGKVDPRGFTMTSMRKRIHDRLAGDKPAPPTTPAPGTSGTYTVRKGDTLWSIAEHALGAGARYREIAALNGLKDADSLTPGQTLKLPGAAKPTPKPKKPVVDLSKLIEAARRNPAAKGTPVTYSGVKTVEAALVDAGLLAKRYSDGHFGTTTIAAYSAWQKRLGYTGRDADGIPGKTSLQRLGDKYGFTVTP